MRLWQFTGIFLLLLTVSALSVADDVRSITGDGVRVRSGPSTDANILTKLNKGDAVTVVEVLAGEPWAKVSTSDFETGWIHTDYLSKPQPAGALTGGFAFAEVSGSGEEIEIHGHFPPGQPVLLISEGQVRTWSATTTGTAIRSNECSGEDYPVTLISRDAGTKMSLKPILAIVGKVKYAPVRLSESRAGESIDAQARIGNPELLDALAQAGGGQFSAAHAGEGAELKFSVLSYTLGTAAVTGVTERGYAVLCGTGKGYIPAGCGALPEFFTVDGKLFCTNTYRGCESGEYGLMVHAVRGNGLDRIYANTDLSC